MKYDQIKNDFLHEIESEIKSKKAKFGNLTGIAQDEAKLHYLEDFKDFTVLMNTKVNEILERYEIQFESDHQFDEFLTYIKPAFDQLHQKYIDIKFDMK